MKIKSNVLEIIFLIICTIALIYFMLNYLNRIENGKVQKIKKKFPEEIVSASSSECELFTWWDTVMICESPITIRAPVNYKDVKFYHVPCGKCISCLKTKRNQWAFRMKEQLRESKGSAFLTLTCNKEHLELTEDGYPTLNKKTFQIFMKRLRKKFGENLKYFACGEYGAKYDRPHYHCILFNCGMDITEVQTKVLQSWVDDKGEIGLVKVSEVNGARIYYTAKYVVSKDAYPSESVVKPFALVSKGLAKGYIDRMKKWHRSDLTRQYAVNPGGTKESLPRYYQDKLFNEFEKEIIKKVKSDYLAKKIVESASGESIDNIRLRMDNKNIEWRKIAKIKNKGVV